MNTAYVKEFKKVIIQALIKQSYKVKFKYESNV